jgi:hypothetical protein
LNWYPAYSYSELPKGYNIDSVPQHWRALVQKVTPPEKGIPYAKNFYISNVKITNAQKAFEVSGLENSLLENFNFTNSSVTAAILGEMVFTKNWHIKTLQLQFLKSRKRKRKQKGLRRRNVLNNNNLKKTY